MSKFSAVAAVVVALLAVPALAGAAPTASQVTTPATTAYVSFDEGLPGSFHVAGTTLGGTGDVDLRCYSGAGSVLLKGPVTVANGSFTTDVALTKTLMLSLGYPNHFCMLRAVPTGTAPSAPVDKPSEWEGMFVSFGWHKLYTVGTGHAPTPEDAVRDYYISRAQSGALNDFESMASCGLCDTYLFVPGTMTASNAIWYANAGLYGNLNGVNGRTGVQVDGASAYSGSSVSAVGGGKLVDNPGFPALSVKETVNPSTGDLTIDETAPYVVCAEDRSVFPPTDASCASFADSGVHYERSIRTRDSGHVVTIVDHWKSVDGKPHELDAIYDDTMESSNAATAGHEGIPNFAWTQDGFKAYAADTQVPLPPTAPATMLVKTDASTPNNGDNMNPIGAMLFGSKPNSLKLVNLSNAANSTSEWQSRYQRTIPAGGELTIAVAYVHDFALASVQAKALVAADAVTPPTLHVVTPLDGATVDAPSVHVAGTASSLDEFNVRVNGTHVVADPATGNWGTDVPLSEGDNRILVSVENELGVVTSEIVHVTRPAAPAPPAETTPSTTTTTTTAAAAVAAKPVRCVVPKLRGKTLRKAKRLLKHAHCRLGKVSRKANAKVKPGRVVNTRFKAGTRHRAGTRIRVTLAKKPAA
jgi:glucodextranase-like protein/PASTA domain-containing protein